MTILGIKDLIESGDDLVLVANESYPFDPPITQTKNNQSITVAGGGITTLLCSIATVEALTALTSVALKIKGNTVVLTGVIMDCDGKAAVGYEWSGNSGTITDCESNDYTRFGLNNPGKSLTVSTFTGTTNQCLVGHPTLIHCNPLDNKNGTITLTSITVGAQTGIAGIFETVGLHIENASVVNVTTIDFGESFLHLGEGLGTVDIDIPSNMGGIIRTIYNTVNLPLGNPFPVSFTFDNMLTGLNGAEPVAD